MNITSKSRYGVRALAELARRSDNRPVPLVSIAEARNIPPQFLEQLFASLRRAGIVRSHRGANGGFTFGRPPEEITVLDVVEALDGPIRPASCTTGEESCELRTECSAADIWLRAKLAVEEVLRSATIKEMAEREAEMSSHAAPMFYI